MFKYLRTRDKIHFRCLEEDWDVIPKPYPARKFIPDWFKALPVSLGPKDGVEDRFENSTIKRCMPFLDAMNLGYIIPLAADVEFTTNDTASEVNWYCKFGRNVIESHNSKQITTDKSPNPMSKFPALKFCNFWNVKTPKGWSTLFLPPINRVDERFICYSGLVDTDNYSNMVNFPFFFTKPNYTGVLKAGTPLVQAIPIKREFLKSLTEHYNEKDEDSLFKFKNKLRFNTSLYRDEIVEKK